MLHFNAKQYLAKRFCSQCTALCEARIYKIYPIKNHQAVTRQCFVKFKLTRHGLLLSTKQRQALKTSNLNMVQYSLSFTTAHNQWLQFDNSFHIYPNIYFMLYYRTINVYVHFLFYSSKYEFRWCILRLFSWMWKMISSFSIWISTIFRYVRNSPCFLYIIESRPL